MGEQLPRLLMNLAAVVLVYHHHHHRRQRRHHHYHHKNNRQHLLNNSKLLRLLMKIKAPQLLCDGWLTARPEQSFLRIFFTGYMLPSLPQPSMVNWTSIPIPVLIIQEVYVAALSAFPPPFKALRTNSTKWYLTDTLVVSKVPRPICWSGLRNLTALQLVTNGWLWWKSPVSKSKSSNLNHWTKRFGCGQYSKHFASNHRKFKHNVLNHQCNHYVHKYLYVMWNLLTKKDNTLNQALLSKAPHISICYQGKSKVRKALIQLQISCQLLAFGYLQEKNVRVRNHPHPSFLEREVSPESVSPGKIVNWEGYIPSME